MNISKFIALITTASFIINPIFAAHADPTSRDGDLNLDDNKASQTHSVKEQAPQENQIKIETKNDSGKKSNLSTQHSDQDEVYPLQVDTEYLWKIIWEKEGKPDTSIPEDVITGLQSKRDHRRQEYRTRGWRIDGRVDRRHHDYERLEDRAFSDIFSDLEGQVNEEIPTTNFMFSQGHKKGGKGEQHSQGDKGTKSESDKQSIPSHEKSDQKSEKSKSRKEYSSVLSQSNWSGTAKILRGNIYDVLFVQGEEFLRRLYAKSGSEDLTEESNTDLIALVLDFVFWNYKNIKEYQGNIRYVDGLISKLNERKFNENQWSDGNFRNKKLLESLEKKYDDINRRITSILSKDEQLDAKKNKTYEKGIYNLIDKIRVEHIQLIDELKSILKKRINTLSIRFSFDFTNKIDKNLISGLQDFVNQYKNFSHKKVLADLNHLHQIKTILQNSKGLESFSNNELARKVNILTAEASFQVELIDWDNKKIRKAISFPVYLKNKDLLTLSHATKRAEEDLGGLRKSIAKDLEKIGPQHKEAIKENLEDPTTMHHSEKALYCNLYDINGLQQVGKDCFEKLYREILEFQRMHDKKVSIGRKDKKSLAFPIKSILLKEMSIEAYSTRSPCGDCEPVLVDEWERIYDGVFNVIEDEMLQHFGKDITLLYNDRGSIIKNIAFTQEEKDNPLGNKKQKDSNLNIGTNPKLWLSNGFMLRKYSGTKVEKTDSIYTPYVPQKMSFFLNEPTLKNKGTLENDLKVVTSTENLGYYVEKYKKFSEELTQVPNKEEIREKLSNLINGFIAYINDYERLLSVQHDIAREINNENSLKRASAITRIQNFYFHKLFKNKFLRPLFHNDKNPFKQPEIGGQFEEEEATWNFSGRTFQEFLVAPDGDCGFTTLGLDRNTAVQRIVNILNGEENSLQCQGIQDALLAELRAVMAEMIPHEMIGSLDNYQPNNHEMAEYVRTTYGTSAQGGRSAYLGYGLNTTGMLAAIARAYNIAVEVFVQGQGNQLNRILEYNPNDPTNRIRMLHTRMEEGGALNHFNLLIDYNNHEQMLAQNIVTSLSKKQREEKINQNNEPKLKRSESTQLLGGSKQEDFFKDNKKLLEKGNKLQAKQQPIDPLKKEESKEQETLEPQPSHINRLV